MLLFWLSLQKNRKVSKNYFAGVYNDYGCYRSFTPSELNREWSITDADILSLLNKAVEQLKLLKELSAKPNYNEVIEQRVLEEAYFSAKIDGFDQKDDEVAIYRRGVEEGVKLLTELPFSGRIIKEVHKILVSGVGGGNIMPGEYRVSQGWVSCALDGTQHYVPTTPQEIVRLISDIEQFANSYDVTLHPLLKSALLYYQFVTIEPFIRGSDAVARALIPLYLVNEGVVSAPVVGLSRYFYNNTQSYHSAIERVRDINDIEGWLRFFLQGVVESLSDLL